MLHRPTSAPVWSPWRSLTDRFGALTGPYSGLFRFVFIAAVLSAVGCLYLWQVNNLSNLHEQTLRLERQASALEQQNVVLAEQLAQWNSPDQVDKRSTQQGYVVASKRTIEAPAAPVPGSSVSAAEVAAAPAEPQVNR
jgi:hypothetical protein